MIGSIGEIMQMHSEPLGFVEGRFTGTCFVYYSEVPSIMSAYWAMSDQLEAYLVPTDT
jgi:hypothetical protein